MTIRSPHQRPLTRQWIALSGWAVLLWSGCASRGQMELLEAEIRQHKDSSRRAEARSADLESQLAMARQETELIRSQVATSGSPVPLPEQTGNLVRLSGVKINTLLSGGKDRDGQPGDDLLVALISPHDQQGDLVKIAGEVEIEAYDMTRSGDNKRVGYWTFDPAQSAKAWHSGFVGAGLQFELPWQEAPSNKELLVHVRLKTSDGRQFDTSSPLKIAPPASNTPGLISVPQAQPVKHETEKTIDREILTADQQLPEEPIARPVPLYDDVESDTARPFPGTDQPPAGKKSPAPVRPAVPNRESKTPDSPPASPAIKQPGRATLDGIETSDNWTDETIPRLR